MSLPQLALGLCQLVLAGLILRRGEGGDRLAAGFYLVVAWLILAVHLLRVPHVLLIAFGLTLVLFLGLWFLAERMQRWWMVGLAGFQLVALLTYLAPANSWTRLKQAFVQFHWMLAVLSLGCLVLALFETGRARRLSAERSDGAGLDAGGGAGSDPALEP